MQLRLLMENYSLCNLHYTLIKQFRNSHIFLRSYHYLHHTFGKRLAAAASSALSVPTILKLDAFYYAGVTAMGGFWLMVGEGSTALADWAAFAASYVSVLLLEPVFTVLIVRGVRSVRDAGWARACFDERLTASA